MLGIYRNWSNGSWQASLSCDVDPERHLHVQQLGEFPILQDLVGGYHRDDLPGADLGAEFAPDADGKIDGTDAHGVRGNGWIGDLVDAIDGADRNTSITSRAKILVENRQLFGKSLFLGHRYRVSA